MADTPTTPNKTTLPTPKDLSIRPDVINEIKQIVNNELINYFNYSGVSNQSSPQILTNFNQTNNEFVVRGKTNSLIVLGHDRPRGIGSGFGGVGQSHCSAVDIIAGHMGTRPVGEINEVKILSDKNFELDSARVYVSQLCNLDEYFGIQKSYIKTGGDKNSKIDIQVSDMRSGVGIKADSVCIVGRENIKLCTHHQGVNSLNNQIHPGGIDIIAGGVGGVDTNLILQPMVKGNNLKDAIQDIIKSISEVQYLINDFIRSQLRINDFLMSHKHQQTALAHTDSMLNAAKIGAESKKLFELCNKQLEKLVNLQTVSNKYLNEGQFCITSKYNRVN